MGIHSGEPAVTKEGYVGGDVHLAARIRAAAHGAKVVVFDATAHLLPAGPITCWRRTARKRVPLVGKTS
jgi:class 3 adenylate cyclase